MIVQVEKFMRKWNIRFSKSGCQQNALFDEKFWDFAQKAAGKICNVPKKKETSIFMFL